MAINFDQSGNCPIKKCFHPWSWMVITTDGFVRCCCLMPGKIGDINGKSIFDDIWNGPIAQKIRHDIINGYVPVPCKGSSCSYVELMYGSSIFAYEYYSFAVFGPVYLLRSDDSSYFLLKGPSTCSLALRGDGTNLIIYYASEGMINATINGQHFILPETELKWSSINIHLERRCTEKQKSSVTFVAIEKAYLKFQAVSLICADKKKLQERRMKALAVLGKTGVYNDNWTSGNAEFLLAPTPIGNYSSIAIMLSGLHLYKTDITRMNIQLQINNIPAAFYCSGNNTLYFHIPLGINIVKSIQIRSNVWTPMDTNDQRKLGLDIISLSLAPDGNDYKWGKDIVMGIGGNSATYRLAGWSCDEEGFTWTEGNHAELGLKIPAVKSGITMHLDASGLGSPIPQSVEIVINGKPLKKVTLPGARHIYNIDIPQEYLKLDAILLIRFDLPNAISPLKAGIADDKRVLSMAVYKLKFSLNKT